MLSWHVLSLCKAILCMQGLPSLVSLDDSLRVSLCIFCLLNDLLFEAHILLIVLQASIIKVATAFDTYNLLLILFQRYHLVLLKSHAAEHAIRN